MKLNELKTILKTKTKNELIIEISTLYKKFEGVKEYYQLKAGDDEDKVVEKYKTIIKKEFFPGPRYVFPRARLSVARKAVSDFKKISQDKYSIADLMVYYVEIGVKFAQEYGDIDEPFYNSMISMFNRVVKIIIKSELEDLFDIRLKAIVNGTEHMGWGLQDDLNDTFYDFFQKKRGNYSKLR